MTIVIEGMDNTGKTTLIKQIMEECSEDMEMVKPPGPWPSKQVLDEWLKSNMERIANPSPEDKILLLDRHPLISEPIYGPGIRNFSMLSEDEVMEGINTFITASQPVIFIYCRPPESVIFNFGDREQMDGVIEKSQLLLRRYDEMIERLGIKVFHHNLHAKRKEPLSSLCIFIYDWPATGPNWVLALMKNHIEQVKRNG